MGWESMRYGERTPAPAACLELLDAPLPQRIVSLIPAGKRGSRAARAAAATLARRQVAAGNGHPVEVEVGGNGYTPKDVVIVPPSEEGAWERIALSSDLAVVVTTDGSRAGEIREVADQLRNLGIEPAWALLDAGRSPRLD